ncbi:MAG TPA: hypothetical protein QF905_01160 [Acidimicrobiales bacterium]|nr:hypothetical protein [Acidimicrobiales bacterium]HJL88922.1 hypothetical protein [Acidimicrobiales bacterium]HJO99792.1 hypothetical protein [Acidimicrobiales bacterium]
MADQDGGNRPANPAGGPPLPHTPPMGIRAVHPGDDPPVAPPTPPRPQRHRERPAPNWLAALISSAGVIAAIMGTFLSWRVADHESGFVTHLIGWDQAGKAVVILVAGLVAAGATGALWTDLRGLTLKLVLLATGLVILAVAGLEIANVLSLDPFDGYVYSVGSGLPVVAAGGALLVLAALVDRGRWAFGSDLPI